MISATDLKPMEGEEEDKDGDYDHDEDSEEDEDGEEDARRKQVVVSSSVAQLNLQAMDRPTTQALPELVIGKGGGRATTKHNTGSSKKKIAIKSHI